MSNEVDPQELKKTPETEPQQLDELEIEELDEVVGGGGKSHPPAPKPQQPYMEIKMNDCIIT